MKLSKTISKKTKATIGTKKAISGGIKNQQKLINEIIDLLGDFESADFSNQLINSTEHGILNPVDDKLNLLLKCLNAQTLLEETQAIAKIGSWRFDLNNHYLSWSREHFKIFEIPEPQSQENLYRLYRSKIHPDDIAKLDEVIELAQKTGQGFTFEHRMICGDGKVKYVEGIGAVTIDKKGNPIRVSGTCQDITERKLLENSLRETRVIFEKFLEHSPIYIFFKDSQIRCLYLSKNYETMLGKPISELLGKTMDEIFPSELSKKMIQDDQRVLQDGKIVEVEETLNGRVFSTLKFPIYEQGVPKYLAGYTFDITDRKKFEKLMEEARTAAEKANHAKDDFLSILSHELRTPLTSILGWIQLLQMGKLDHVKSKQAIDSIEKSANIQGQLINDLLDISRIQAGKLDLTVQEIDLNIVISAAIDSTRSLATSKSIQIKTEVAPSVKTICTDPIRLQQILWNLITNSIKFSPQNGKIWIKVDQMISSTGEQICIQVRDNGKGINSEFLPIIFQRFTQVDSTSTRAYGGLGLGLAIVKQLTEMLGGAVKVESEGEGKGATFTVCIPTRPFEVQKVVESKLDSEVEIDLNGLKILLVEDEASTKEVLEVLLRTFGSEVKIAGSAKEGLEILEKFKPDVLVSDIAMPIEDGYSLIKKVRALKSELRKTPALALTAFASADDIQRMHLAGFQAHLTKPADSKKLALAITRLILQK